MLSWNSILNIKQEFAANLIVLDWIDMIFASIAQKQTYFYSSWWWFVIIIAFENISALSSNLNALLKNYYTK